MDLLKDSPIGWGWSWCIGRIGTLSTEGDPCAAVLLWGWSAGVANLFWEEQRGIRCVIFRFAREAKPAGSAQTIRLRLSLHLPSEGIRLKKKIASEIQFLTVIVFLVFWLVFVCVCLFLSVCLSVCVCMCKYVCNRCKTMRVLSRKLNQYGTVTDLMHHTSYVTANCTSVFFWTVQWFSSIQMPSDYWHAAYILKINLAEINCTELTKLSKA